MSVDTNFYESILSQDTSRGPSAGIWGSADIAEFLQNSAGGYPGGSYFFDDFNDMPAWILYNGERQVGKWNIWCGNNSGAIIGDGADTTNLPMEGGVLGIYGGTTAIDITMCSGGGAIRPISPATNYPFVNKIYFEARVSFSVATSAYGDLFVGLMDRGDAAGTRITSAASLCFSATNTLKTATGNGACLGFWKRATTNPGDYCLAYNVNNGTAQTPGSSSTAGPAKILTNSGVTGYTSGLVAMSSTNNIPVAQTFVKLGFLFDPTASCRTMRCVDASTANQTVGTVYAARVQLYLNGQLLPWFLNTSDVQAATFPSTFMVPTIGYRSGGTAAGIAYVDWIRVASVASY